MPKKRGKNKLKEDSKLFAFLAVLLSVLGFILGLLAKKDDEYVMFYAKQSLILFLPVLVVKALTILLAITIIGLLAIPVVWVIYFVIWAIALINSVSGAMKETPFVGKYARKINL